MAAPVVPEKALHAAVAQFLARALPLRCPWTTVPLGGGGKIRGAHLKAAGTRKGWPDIEGRPGALHRAEDRQGRRLRRPTGMPRRLGRARGRGRRLPVG